ncbi:hypothetical protein CH352_14460 [Leptospira hartskeerlii]|uniref:Uncharacterized protein n=1 Tax=Leptospira hartskeerlii TaxID=2023177 RepID=A0A2M9X9S7_9LEPT|nr:hypothetical protein [Leptospira hartskeerlii]PJZ24394.1 hypothetical protein CH357_15045 [Leptospira hartskeerlii]PJZ32994.1 hypothetical protein CH352_14460 [Leptospira hartskeerlii]
MPTPYPTPETAFNRFTPNDGNLLGSEFGRLYTNDNTLQNEIDEINAPEFDNGNSGASKTINFGVGYAHRLILDSANCVLSFSGPKSGKVYSIFLIQDTTGGRTVTWPSSVVWPGGVAPILSSGPNKADLMIFYYSGSKYYGSYSQNYATA